MSSKRPATSPGPTARMVIGTADPNDGRPSSSLYTLQKRHSAINLTTHDTVVTAPPRPPRNPARAGDAEGKPKKTKRPSTATGTREEVTPWEFFFPSNAPTEGETPIPTTAETAKPSNVTATGKREDVLPWELLPTPDYDGGATKPVINASHTQTNHSRQQSRSSISSSFHDMALLRRRKSTGTRPSHSSQHSPNPPVAFAPSQGASRISTSTNNSSKSPSSSPRVLHKTPSASTVRPPLPKASSGPVPTVSSLETVSPTSPHSPAPQTHLQAQEAAQDPKFSTADRTILKELKRNISARAAQFVIKGGPAESGTAGSGASFTRLGAKHHAYNREEVPYPRSYAREVLDLDIWETMACQAICNSLTWHVFATPPTKVLDIGCGTGTWILNCARAWKDCHFVGLDIVPLHPNLGGSELSKRITWVQANFLESLPFAFDEFDFVHIKRIALGVPEDKWDGLFEEVARVLKPGGAFELIEEDLFFPGKASDEDDDSDSDVVSEMRYARRSSETSDIDDDESLLTGSGGSRQSYEGSAPTPNTSLGAIPATPPRTASPLPIVGIREEVIEEEAPHLLENKKLFPVASPARPSSHRHSYQPRSSSATLSPGQPRHVSGSSTSLHDAASQGTDRRRGYSTSTLVSPSNQHPSVLSTPAPASSSTATDLVKPPFSPFLLRTLPKAPPNPRDHSLLERIYNEMNATRFINLAPLSLLANLVGLYFKDVRTHPPLQLTFPPPTLPVPVEEASTDETDSDGARNAIIPRPNRRQSVKSFSTSPSSPRSATFSDTTTLTDEQHRWVNTTDLLKHESRYISLDDARMSAFSPSPRSSFPAPLSPVKSTFGLPVVEVPDTSGAGNDPPKLPIRMPGSRNRLPNATFNIDVRSLNMHLALRTAEIIACSESMWEWVVSYQKSFHAQRAAGRPRAGSLASEMTPRSSRIPILPPDPEVDAFKSAVLELSREDFDSLLVKFDLDMRDQMALGSTLRDQFSWSCMPLAPSQDRKAFIAACERWEQWQDQQRRKKSPFGRHRPRSSIDAPHAHEGNGTLDRHGTRPEALRGNSSLPKPNRRRSSTSSSGVIPPERRLSRSLRVFIAWQSGTVASPRE